MVEDLAFSEWDGDGGPEAALDWQNSLMVTVRWLVATSVTTTLAQVGVLLGCQSGSPGFGAVFSVPSPEEGLDV